MSTPDHGLLTSDIRPSTVSLIWRAERSDLPLTVEAALARARRRLLDQGATVTPVDAETLAFEWPRGRARGVSWSSQLSGCKVRAAHNGSAVAVTVEASFALFIVYGLVFVGLPFVAAGLWVVGDLMAVVFVVMGIYASSRLKDVARFAMCMIPDDDGAV